MFELIQLLIFVVIIGTMIFSMMSSINKKVNQVNIVNILKDKKYLKVYKDIVSGYKVEYKNVKPPLSLIAAIIISILFIINNQFLFFLAIIGIIIYLIYLKINNKNNKVNIKNNKFLDIYKKIILTIFTFMLLIILFETKNLLDIFIILMIVIISTINVSYIYKYIKERKINLNNNNKCEYHIIEKLGKSFYSDFKELDNNMIYEKAVEAYKNSNLCEKNYDNLCLKDCFNFSLKENINVNIYNITAEKSSEIIFEYSNKSKNIVGNYGKSKTIEFEGVLTEIIMDFSINGYIKITRDSLNKIRKNKVQLDSSEFEKRFDVNASNKIILMQLLTSDFMAELNDLLDKYNIYFEIYILDNKMYITFNESILNFDKYFLDFDNPLKKPDLKLTYIKYCKLRYLINIIELFYNKLKEI